MPATQFEKERGVTHIKVLEGIAHARVRLDAPEGRLPLLRALSEADIPIFLVKLQDEGLTFAVRQEHAPACQMLLQLGGWEHELSGQMALVSTHAGAMRDLSGVIARIYDALLAKDIVVRQTGDSYDAVHALVDGAQADAACKALEAALIGGAP